MNNESGLAAAIADLNAKYPFLGLSENDSTGLAETRLAVNCVKPEDTIEFKKAKEMEGK